MSQIIVVGSINVDIVSRVVEYPVPGQTISSKSTEFYYGGKGANQAVAGARAGGSVSMIGAVGTDPFGKGIVDSLQRQDVSTSSISFKPGATGMAYIMVNDAGQNEIVLTEGANGSLLPVDVDHIPLDSAKVILLQNEIPWETNLSVMKTAQAKGIQLLFNPAPAIRITRDALPLVGTLVLNESEAEYMTGRRVTGKEEAMLAARQFLDSGVHEVIITLGEQGSLYMDHNGNGTFTPAFSVKAVDTTSAGDTFIGFYAAGISKGISAHEALRYASAAAALSVTRHGAQSSIPTREEADQFIKRNSGERNDGHENECKY